VALPLSDFLLVEISAMSYNLDGVKAIYEAFGKGDISGILERLSEAGRWEQWTDNEARKAGVPWLQSRIGKEGVAEFFTIVVFEQPDFQHFFYCLQELPHLCEAFSYTGHRNGRTACDDPDDIIIQMNKNARHVAPQKGAIHLLRARL
jgi:hypothetical protein